ncbi:stalk domain-containing protein [Cohnella herbarum]|uniref:Copper amine oxidase-like N-terminal domain-containing protein n=1 Tax=Cohnella herbarum TaxID=2728023 RepID=A0A7Z2ZNF2_9BACL|nr:stalk domain-containing protein [Cohnella herbarum]QJD86361.1 hypothetical protein HH215_26475 [Cohnella herbarum]
MKRKWTVLMMSAALFVSTSVGVYAGTNLQEIKAYLNGNIKIKVDGKPAPLVDDKGKPVLPIVYNSTTYLPVRAVSDVLGVAVDWDAASSTVLLGEKVDGVSIDTGDDISIHITKDPDLTKYNGKDYKTVITYMGNDSIVLYPKKKYQKLYLQTAALGKDVELIIRDSDTFRSLKTATVAVADGLKTIEVDIGGLDTISVMVESQTDGGYFIPLTTSYFK